MPAPFLRPDLVTELLAAIQARLPDTAGPEGLSEAEADLLAAATVHGLVGNGGHLFWYEGMDREDTLRAVSALERMDLFQQAAALKRSLQAFPDGTPPKDLAERRYFLSANRERLAAEFDALDRAMWKTDFDQAAQRYALRRRAELLQANPALSALFAPEPRREPA